MQKYYSFLHNDKEVRDSSSSGGAFTLISDLVLEEGGAVYGCALDSELKARHIRAVNRQARDRMRTSKYIQSDMLEVFPEIRKDLLDGKKVLFSGTPCQVYAVRQYLKSPKMDDKNLILLEVICHGVGSERFFRDYICHLESRYKGKAVYANFRAKRHKGQKQDMEIRFDNGRTYNASSTKYDWYYSTYHSNLILRPSCYECPFAKGERYADLSLADHWGHRDPEAHSLIVCNSVIGENILKKADSAKLVEISEADIRQTNMHGPSKRPGDYDTFWKIYLSKGYLSVQKWFGNNTVKGKICDTLARIAYFLHIAGILKRLRTGLLR